MTVVFHAQLLTELRDSFRKKVHIQHQIWLSGVKYARWNKKKVCDGMHVVQYYAVKYNICMTNLLRRGRLCTNFCIINEKLSTNLKVRRKSKRRGKGRTVY